MLQSFHVNDTGHISPLTLIPDAPLRSVSSFHEKIIFLLFLFMDIFILGII